MKKCMKWLLIAGLFTGIFTYCKDMNRLELYLREIYFQEKVFELFDNVEEKLNIEDFKEVIEHIFIS